MKFEKILSKLFRRQAALERKRTRIIVTVACVIFFFCLLGMFFPSRVRIGVVSMPRVYQEATVFQSIRQQQQAYEEKWRQEAIVKKEALEREDRNLSLQKKNLKKAVFDKRVAALNAKILEFQNTQVARLGLIRENTRHILQETQKQSEPILKQLAKKHNIDVVLTDANVIFVADRVDITDDLIKELNKTLTEVDWEASISWE